MNVALPVGVSGRMPGPLVLRALLASVEQAWKAQFIFRTSTWTGIIGTVLQVTLVFLVWSAVYGERTEVVGIDQRDAINYAALGVLVNTVIQPFIFDSMYSRLRSGAIAFDVMRPVSAVPLALAQQVGSSLAQLPSAACALALGLAIGAVSAPPTPLSALAFAISMMLGYLIALLINFSVGLVGFWTLETGGAFNIYRMFAQFSSGAMIPLWFMPNWLAGALTALPFSAQVFVPLSIYLDPSPGWHTIQAMALQLLWVLLMAGVAMFVWRRAIRRLVIFGG